MRQKQTTSPSARAGIPRFGVVCLKKLTTPKKSRWRAKNKKTPKKHKNTPKKRKNTPQKHKNTPKRRKKHPKKNFRAYARKKTPLFQKLIDFAGTPRPPATPGIPALPSAFRNVARAHGISPFCSLMIGQIQSKLKVAISLVFVA